MSQSASDVSDAFITRLLGLTGAVTERKALDVLLSWHDQSAPIPDHVARRLLGMVIEVARIEILRTGDEEENDAPEDEPAV